MSESPSTQALPAGAAGPDAADPRATGPAATGPDATGPDATGAGTAPPGAARPDAAARMLARAVRLLPPGRRDWGAAMQAELDALTEPDERRRFAIGCVAAVGSRPAVWRRIGYALLPVEYGALGTRLEVEGRAATVVRMPFIDPEKAIAKS